MSSILNSIQLSHVTTNLSNWIQAPWYNIFEMILLLRYHCLLSFLKIFKHLLIYLSYFHDLEQVINYFILLYFTTITTFIQFLKFLVKLLRIYLKYHYSLLINQIIHYIFNYNRFFLTNLQVLMHYSYLIC